MLRKRRLNIRIIEKTSIGHWQRSNQKGLAEQSRETFQRSKLDPMKLMFAMSSDGAHGFADCKISDGRCSKNEAS